MLPSTAAGAGRKARMRARIVAGSRRAAKPGALANGEEAAGQQGERVGEPEDDANREAGEAGCRDQQFGEADEGGGDEDGTEQASPFVGDREEALGEAVHQGQHDEVGGDQGEAGADDPQRGDEGRLRATLAARAAIVAGKLNSVRPVRPRITTSTM